MIQLTREMKLSWLVWLVMLLAIGRPIDGSGQTPVNPAGAQSSPTLAAEDAQNPPDTDYVPPVEQAPARIPATAYLMPDLPDEWNEATSYDGRGFSTNFSLVPLIDYSAFVQDEDSESQVGVQDSQWDVRTLRLMFRGAVKFAHPVDYFVSVEVKGQDHVQAGDSKLGLTDLEVSTMLGRLGRLRFGKIKEPFVYEMVGDAANLQQQERGLNPFFISRGIGLKLTNSFRADSMTWSVGWFNDWWVEDQQFEVSGNDVVGRFTWVPYWSNNGATYLHLGVDGRHTTSDEGTLRFRGRPESNVTDYYVDSGTLDAEHANQLALESAWGRGPFFMTAEYANALVDAADSGDPTFWGGSVVLSYVLTGEHRPYDKKVGYARRVLPLRRSGAFELVGRYSHVDVADRLVDGGVFDRVTAGINWWATRRWKIGFDYGFITLERSGIGGVTHAFHTRFQWVY
jgi:phosphate-selective porin